VATNSTGRLFINSSGQVGLGTSSPSNTAGFGQQFEIAGSLPCININQNDAGFTTRKYSLGVDSAGSFGVWDNTASAYRMHINSSGSVGIGTTSPTAQLTSASTVQVTGFANPSGGAGLELGYDGTNSIIQSFNRGTSAHRDLFLSGNTIQWSIAGGEAARIDSSRRLLVGTSTARANFYNLTLSTAFQVEGTTHDTSGISIVRNQSGNASHLALAATRGTTVGSNTIVQSGDTVGAITFQGSDGTEFIQLAEISGAVDGTPGANDMPGRLVFSVTRDGASSPTEALRIANTGRMTSASDQNIGQLIVDNTNGSYTSTLVTFDSSTAAGSGWYFLACQSGNGADNEILLRGDGNGLADGSWVGGGADYAEYFEWSDGNPDEDDRRGISVVLDDEKIRPAVDGEDPIGVISGNPSVVGDAAWNKWSGKYLRDDYGTYIQEDYEVEDEDGNTVIQQRRKPNPAYNPDQKYVNREQRPEWDCVGLMGKLRIRKGQPTGSRWIKMREISDSVEEWLVR
jgi:hypothetical protein